MEVKPVNLAVLPRPVYAVSGHINLVNRFF